jgi:voltage-gated potassium channel
MLKRVYHHHKFMIGSTLRLLRELRRPIFLYLSALSFSTIALSSGLMFFLERQVNPKLSTYFDALYFSVTTMTGVGYGDVVPVTTLGRVLAMAMMLGGTALFVVFTATLATLLLEHDFELAQTKDS